MHLLGMGENSQLHCMAMLYSYPTETGHYMASSPTNRWKYSFLFNNQPDALIIQIYCVIKLYMFRATSSPIIRSFLLYIRHW